MGTDCMRAREEIEGDCHSGLGSSVNGGGIGVGTTGLGEGTPLPAEGKEEGARGGGSLVDEEGPSDVGYVWEPAKAS